MNPQEYQNLTDALYRTLEFDTRVVGLMAAGSMAGLSHQPDEWSDHDFWLIVQPGEEAWFQTHAGWLPDSDRIILFFREAEGGFKAVYQSGHLLEFAVSDFEGLRHARINDYRLLIDRDGLAADLAHMQQTTTTQHGDLVRDDLGLLGQFITNLLVGVGRYRRGEQMSARQLITVSSLYGLLRLVPKHIPAEQPETLDNIDPLRRVEMVYPTIGAEINQLLRLDLDQAALGLLDLADRLLKNCIANYPAEAVAVVRRFILG